MTESATSGEKKMQRERSDSSTLDPSTGSASRPLNRTAVRLFHAMLLVTVSACVSVSPDRQTPYRQVTRGIGAPYGTRLSPDGRRLAFTLPRHGSQAIFVISTEGGEPKQLTDWKYDSSRPSWSPDGRRIAFASNRGGAKDIWVMDADGANARQLTVEETLESDPAWSPDGGWIAYSSNRKGNENIWMVPAAGGQPVQLTHRTTGDAWAVGWSRDGKLITFIANWESEGARGRVWVMPIQGTMQPRQLTRGAGRESQPAWSPDGRWIAFTSDRGGQFDLWMMPLDGGKPVQLTNDDAIEDFPTWSRDGRFIAYDTGKVVSSLWKIRADRGVATPLNIAHHGSWLTQTAEPVYSPDGHRVAFQSYANGNRDIWLAALDGSAPVPLTNHPADDKEPAWSPDGKSLAFASSRDGAARSDIWIISVDGTNARRLTRIGTAQRPAWCERGRSIVFDAEGTNGRELQIVQVTGEGPETLPSKFASYADCSPAGNLVAFQRYVGKNVVEVSLLSLRDETTRDFTTFGKRTGSPRWSPDGTKIAFVSNKDGPQDLYLKDVSSGEIVRLTSGDDVESRPTWSPDGSSVIFGAANNSREIWILDVAAVRAATPRQ